MVWINPNLDPLIEHAKKTIFKHFRVSINIAIYVSTLVEMTEAVIEELKFENREEWEIKYAKIVTPFLEGKYFRYKKQIWLMEGKGEKKFVILHEMIHSIQECQPNRENINDYICYRLLKTDSFIEQKILIEWQEIEKNIGFKAILAQILTDGDCEDL